ncbi:MAG: DUF4430 domain-containing protein [Candidatus Diapherotrites archaeon]|nr:DUF4430 domain-containing protein [Candidatus Diapherotrites archaeon]
MVTKTDKLLLVAGVVVVALVAFILGVYYGSGSPEVPVGVARANSTVHLMIDYGNGTVSSYHFTLKGANATNTSAYALLVAASREDGFKIEQEKYDFGFLVTGINGVHGGDKPKHYWLYWVNAESPDKASNVYLVSPGDVVEFKYGYVSWS